MISKQEISTQHSHPYGRKVLYGLCKVADKQGPFISLGYKDSLVGVMDLHSPD